MLKSVVERPVPVIENNQRWKDRASATRYELYKLLNSLQAVNSRSINGRVKQKYKN